jgi:hypothetical protein
MAILDKKFNLSEKPYELNHGELFAQQFFHWNLHMRDWFCKSLGETSSKCKEYTKKCADELSNLETITFEELDHYRTKHKDAYLNSIMVYLDYDDVPKDAHNFALGITTMPDASGLPSLISNDIDYVKKMVNKNGK